MTYSPFLLPKVRSKAIRQACAHMPCTLRISSLYDGHNCAGQTTVVGCHLESYGKGVNTKVTDMAIAAGCANCHDIIDRRDPRWECILDRYPAMFYERMLKGLTETHAMLIAEGIIQIPDDKPVGVSEADYFGVAAE